MLARRRSTLVAFGAVLGLVTYRTFSKCKQQMRLEEQYQSIIKKYLQRVNALPRKDAGDKKALIAEWRCDVKKFEHQSTAASDIVFREFAMPSGNELGHLVIEMLTIWNDIAYDALCDKLEEIIQQKTAGKVCILELGPGGGDAIQKLYQRLAHRVHSVHAFDLSHSSISTLHRRFASQIASDQVAIEFANIGHGTNDEVIRRTLTQNPNGKYDLIFHLNCFYFWDNLPVCGQTLAQLLTANGCLVGGFRWKYLFRCNPHIFKNRKQSQYEDMLRQTRMFDMDALTVMDNVGGDDNYQIIAAYKKK